MTIQGIHVDNVTASFADQAETITPPLHFDLFASGYSNLTLRVTHEDDHQWVLRRPPAFQPEGGTEALVGRIDALGLQAADYAAKVA